MRLVAQRVQSPRGEQGINAFYYARGAYVWLDAPPPEVAQSRGHLLNRDLELKPGGNRVRSYLEILAPDRTPNHTIEKDIVNSIDLFSTQDLPLNVQRGDSTFEFNVELALAPAWRRELTILLYRALAVRI